MVLILTVDDWVIAANQAEARGDRVVIGASCERCYLEITPSEAHESQCQCGKSISIPELATAHGLEREIPSFIVTDVSIEEKTG